MAVDKPNLIRYCACMTNFDPARIRHQARLLGLEYHSLDGRWIELRLRDCGPCVVVIQLSTNLGAAQVYEVQVWSEDEMWLKVWDELRRLHNQINDVLEKMNG